MPRILPFALVLFLIALPVAFGQSCKPAARTKAKNTAKRKKALAKRNEAKAAARLEKAKLLLDAGKRDQAIPRLWKIVSHYPRTRTAITALIILRFARLEEPEEQEQQ
jgi:hypothetical protein